ncbi:DsbA family oxidoreductase [Brucella gallinifaecis]|uniref:DsbA family oxidoreductase n=1 Tax=Brucella gallinifaecis TaxID=215590 RepID=UPI00236172C9|nr:DsbA family oxidoreductase [Brucella gallinifaecis]
MQLQIWSDYACPYCYIGKRHLEEALAEFEHADDVEVVFRTFELDRTASPQVINTTQQRIEYKYRKNPESAREMINHIIAMGARAGLKMNYDTVRYTNTFDAHRLTHYAQVNGLAAEMSERLFRAYFTENRELADQEVLLSIASDVGLNRSETEATLKSGAFIKEAREEEAQAESRGIHGVPFFAFEDGTGLSGAQPKSVLLRALRDSWNSSQARPSANAPSCDNDTCDVPEK